MMILFAANWSSGISRSTNNGESWTTSSNGLTAFMFYSLAINSNNYIFAGTYEYVFRSTDNGESWVELSNGLGSWDIRSLAINSLDYIFAGT